MFADIPDYYGRGEGGIVSLLHRRSLDFYAKPVELRWAYLGSDDPLLQNLAHSLQSTSLSGEYMLPRSVQLPDFAATWVILGAAEPLTYCLHFADQRISRLNRLLVRSIMYRTTHASMPRMVWSRGERFHIHGRYIPLDTGSCAPSPEMSMTLFVLGG